MMKLKTKLEFELFDKHYSAIGNKNTRFKGIVNVSKVGKFILDLMENDITKDEIVNKMTEKYDVDSDRARAGLEKFLKEIEPLGIIEYGANER